MLDPFSVMEEESPAEPSTDLGESMQRADGGTFWGFLAAAILAQAGLFATSLGLMFAGFRGQWRLGGVLVAGGVVALGATVGIVWWHRTR
jgi:hypothetical protein